MKTRTRSLSLIMAVFGVACFCCPRTASSEEGDEQLLLQEELAPYLEEVETVRWSLTNPFSEALVQTAEKQVQTIRTTPASIDVVTSEEIKRYGFATLSDYIASLPGFYSYYPLDYRLIGVRGFCRQGEWNNRILFLVDGHTLNSDFDGSALLEDDFGVDLESVERIEIVRGPGSALYGSNALYAVVNIITKSGDALSGGQVKAGAGSFRTWSTGASFGKRISPKLNFLLSGHFLDSQGRNGLYFPEFDDPPVSDGKVKDTDYLRNWVTFGKVTYGDFSFKVLAKSREKGLPQGAFYTTFNDTRNFLVDGMGFGEARWDREIKPNLSLSSRVYLDYFHYNGSFYYEDYGDFPLNKEGWNDWVAGAEAKLNWWQSRLFKLLGGAEYRYHYDDFYLWYESEEGEMDEESESRWTKDSHFGAAFVYGRLEPFAQLHLNLGLRYDHFPGFGGEVNPRAGVVYSPYSTGTFKLLYGQAFRAPSRYEYDYTDIYYYLPNENLDPEKLHALELVYEQTIRHTVFLTLSGYYSEIRNLIDQAEIYDPAAEIEGPLPDQEIIDWVIENTEPGEPYFLQFQNSGKVRSLGADLSARGRWPSGIEGFANVTVQQTEEVYEDETFNLTNSPRFYGNLGVSFPVPYTRKHLFFSPHLQYSAERDITGVDEQTDAYFFLTNVTLFWRGLPRNLEAAFSVYNLFDIEYSHPGGGDFPPTEIPQDGLSFHLQARYLIR